MNKVLHILCTLLLLGLLASNCLAQNSWTTFRDEKLNFRFLYPHTWIQGTPRGVNVKATLFSPKGLPRANCNIVVKKDSSFSGDTKAYLDSEISRSPLTPQDWKAMLGTKWRGVRIIESKTVKVDNHSAYLAIAELIHETVDKKTYGKTLHLFTITPGMTWNFTCMAKGSTIEESRQSFLYWKKTFYRILGSLVFETWASTSTAEDWEGKKLLIDERDKVISACENGVLSRGFPYDKAKKYCECSVNHMTMIATQHTKDQLKKMAETKGKDFIEKEALKNCLHHLE